MPHNTPILENLIVQAEQTRLALHVPGHKLGRLLPSHLSVWLGAAARLDLTELPGLDNFHQPEECIADSQALAASHYGSSGCLYSVNGSSAGVMAAIMACVAAGQSVLFLGPFHLSAWRGLIVADAKPVFEPTEFSYTRQSYLAPSAEFVLRALRAHPDVAAVFLTSPSYTGAVSPVSAIAKVCHDHGLPLIVDEAHGAHFGLHEALPKHSLQCGADVVIHSVHKMLPGLTQTAWVHWQGQLVQPDRLAESLRLLHSTSPSYLLLASLDAAQAWLRTSGGQTVRESLPRVMAFHQSVGNIPGMEFDPYRLWLPTGDLGMSVDLKNRFAKSGIVVEYADAGGVLCLFPLDIRDVELETCLSLITEWQQTWSNPVFEAVSAPDMKPTSVCRQPPPSWVMTPREAYSARKRRVPIADSTGNIGADLITPYPPGVPLLFPGQLITPDHQVMMTNLFESGYEVHGLGTDGTISVIDAT